MNITNIKAIYPKYRHVVPSWRTQFWQIVVRVETDAGVAGMGYGGGGVAGVEIINGHFRELLIGHAVNGIDDVTAIWDLLYEASLPYGRKGLAIMALSGVDLALYDLLGKAEGKPVYEVLGNWNQELAGSRPRSKIKVSPGSQVQSKIVKSNTIILNRADKIVILGGSTSRRR
ncbi:MAG: hypothetical protein IIC23_08355 [Chloroflexi bacterium]|nr:hypothetical protein [Chloroflexota bacterium]